MAFEVAFLRKGTVVVTVSVVRVVEVAADGVVHVVTMRNALMATALPMGMTMCMLRARVIRRAGSGIVWPNGEAVLMDFAIVLMVEVAVMKVVGVPIVSHRSVSAAFLMLMPMLVVRLAAFHEVTSWPIASSPRPLTAIGLRDVRLLRGG